MGSFPDLSSRLPIPATASTIMVAWSEGTRRIVRRGSSIRMVGRGFLRHRYILTRASPVAMTQRRREV